MYKLINKIILIVIATNAVASDEIEENDELYDIKTAFHQIFNIREIKDKYKQIWDSLPRSERNEINSAIKKLKKESIPLEDRIQIIKEQLNVYRSRPDLIIEAFDTFCMSAGLFEKGYIPLQTEGELFSI